MTTTAFSLSLSLLLALSLLARSQEANQVRLFSPPSSRQKPNRCLHLVSSCAQRRRPRVGKKILPSTNQSERAQTPECRFNVTSLPSISSANSTADNRTGIHSGIIKNSDVPDVLLDYTKEHNVSLECIWNITVTPGWKVSVVLFCCLVEKKRPR